MYNMRMLCTSGVILRSQCNFCAFKRITGCFTAALSLTYRSEIIAESTGERFEKKSLFIAE